MYNQPSQHPNKLKKAASNPFIGSLNGGSTQDVTTDANGMTGVSNPRQVPFSPASARTFELNQQQGMNQAQQARAAAAMNAKQQQAASPLNATQALQGLKPSEQNRIAKRLRNRGI